PEDFDAYAGFMADADFTRHINGAVMARSDAWRSFAYGLGHWVLRGYGFWAVERKSDGAYLGRVGLSNPEGWPGLEVGWSIGKAYWGNGYAPEAARAARNYAFLTQPVDRLISVIAPENLASQAVARKVGETRGECTEVVVRGAAHSVDIWSISREKWQSETHL
ncbi:MAG: GNAT family N-acetyltransferase, partial [Rhizomicrobium sp.]